MKPPRETPFASEKAFSVAAIKRIRGPWGGEVLNVHGGVAAQTRGTPDLLACVTGFFYAIELKQPGERPTPLQMKRLREWQAAGAVAGWVTTEAELDALLSQRPGWINPQLATRVGDSADG